MRDSAAKISPPLQPGKAPAPEPTMAELPYNGQDIANLAWGFANAGVHEPRLLRLMARVASCRLASLRPHDCAELAWALAVGGVGAPLLFEQMAKIVEGHAPAG